MIRQNSEIGAIKIIDHLKNNLHINYLLVLCVVFYKTKGITVEWPVTNILYLKRIEKRDCSSQIIISTHQWNTGIKSFS